MQIRKHQNLGFTLNEFVVVLAVLGVLISFAIPSLTELLANVQIRTGTEALQNGLQLARVEAVRRNANVTFTLNAGSGWTVGCQTVLPDNNADGVEDCPAIIQSRSNNEGSTNVTVAVTPVGANVLTFNGLGRVIANTPVSPSITRIDVDNPTISPANSRDLRVAIQGASVKICLPGINITGDPRTCPP